MEKIEEAVAEPFRVHFSPGEHISNAAKELVAAAFEHGSAEGSFNDIVLRADKLSSPAGVVADFERQLEHAREAYRNSPEGKAAEQRNNNERATLQAKHDALMRLLPSLDFRNRILTLDWLCEMQDPSDRTGVIVRRETIVEAFAKNGFLPNVNCGDEFRANDCDNVFRWLVGQALAGLSEGLAIHSIIHKFAAEWKAKFWEVLMADDTAAKALGKL